MHSNYATDVSSFDCCLTKAEKEYGKLVVFKETGDDGHDVRDG